MRSADAKIVRVCSWHSGALLLRLLRFGMGAAVAAILYAGLLTQTLCAGQASDASEFINIERLSDRVRLGYWVGPDRRCNLTAIRTQKGLVLIDSEFSPRVMAPIKAKFERLFGCSNWVYVINTHGHDSHPGGNSLFKGAVIVGHDNLEEDMRWAVRRQTDPVKKKQVLDRSAQIVQELQAALVSGYGRDPAQARLIRAEIMFQQLHSQDVREGYPLVKPTLTFADKKTLDLGDMQLELVFFGKGHSLADILIYVPQERLLVSGSVVYQRAQFPEIAEESTLEDVQRFIAVLNRFLADDVKISHVVPSHSPVLAKRDLVPVRDYYQRMLTGFIEARREGLTFEQVKERFPRSMFPAFWERPRGWSHGFHERNLRNLWRIVQEKDEQKKDEKSGA